ncbi:alpha-amylase family glycosyl hydrolase [soil metagenome]
MAASVAPLWPAFAQSSPALRDRVPSDEVIYFALPDRFANGDPSNDRGGITGDRLKSGYDPADAGFYHGGDLAGLTARLDYIQGLGTTAIWLGPIYKNKPVQGAAGHESAGYHGYWIVDFTDVDPHFGTKADLKTLVDAAHARGLKVYLDIITNHTADVIQYRDCPVGSCAYRSKADYPYSRKGGVGGVAINDGFGGDGPGNQTAANFAELTRSDYAYETVVPRGEARAKTPDWLNDPRYYHNRGDTNWAGESLTYGDFSGLDDLFTEHPRVVEGFIEIYGRWIDEFGVDGFRVDTARHVNPEFWQAFVPAMLARAKARGIPNFHIFGEVSDVDPGVLARFTRADGYPAVLDFAFQRAVTDAVNGQGGTSQLARLFASDALYEGGGKAALQLPTFLGNHDMGRIGGFIAKAHPEASGDELLARDTLAHAMLMFLRGVPVIYYGDEQGFTGDGDDRNAREDMFASQVASYNDNRLIGGGSGSADRYDADAALYRRISAMAKVRSDNPVLRQGLQVVRATSDQPGLFAVSRRLDGREGLIAFNTSDAAVTVQVEVDTASLAWRALQGYCPSAPSAPGSYTVRLAPFQYMVCVSEVSR